MSAIISDQKNLYYTRDYKNDCESPVGTNWKDNAQRVALVAMPFLALHAPFRPAISIGMGALRVWTHGKDLFTSDKEGFELAYQALQTTVAVIGLVGAIFAYPACMIVTTAQDTFIELKNFSYCIQNKDYKEALKSFARVVNNVLYLTLLCRGGLELAIVSLLMQAIVLMIASVEEFQKGRILEGCGNLLMTAVRLHQGYSQYEQLKRKWEIEEAIKNVKVGELHEKWQFPSDHLPVGIEVDGVRIISWNVLNDAYMEWVTTKDSQGLNGSMISDLDHSVQADGLTQRDLFIANMVVSMTASGQIVALQECGEPFLKALQERLPENWGMVRSFDQPRTDQEVILYNKSSLVYHADRSGVTTTAYPSVPRRPIQQVQLSRIEEGGKDICLINAHIPGDPTLPAREEFARYVHDLHQMGQVTIALGDNNFERDEMADAYRKAGFSEFSLHSPWHTNVDPYTKDSKSIDHLFVIGSGCSRDLIPDEVIQGANLQETMDLLNGRAEGNLR